MPANLLQNPAPAHLAILDWPSMLQPLLDLTHFKANIKYWLGPFDLKTPADLTKHYQTLAFFEEHQETLAAFLAETLHTMNGEQDLDLAALAKGLLATWEELHLIGQMLESFLAMQTTFANLAVLPTSAHASLKFCQQKFLPRLRELILANGEIDFLHHPLLAEIFQKQQALGQIIRQHLQQLAQSEPFASALQYQEHDCLHGNFVLAVKADHYQSSLGNIIAKSHRGNTLLVAPPAIKALNRQWQELENAQQEILLRLQYEFNELLRPHTACLRAIQEQIYQWDRWAAASAFARQFNLQRPTLRDDFGFNIKGFFHPLIKNPVRNDFVLAPSQDGLILSGPNTGGKTVVLKSIAIIYLFMYRGLYVPAQEAHLAPLTNLYYIALDQQDLTAELSSFAAEARNYLDLLGQLGSQNLIIIDEIFNSTSSEDASALALAFLQEFTKRAPTKIILSTHHQILKTFMHQNPRYVSAKMDFDQAAQKPTYHLVPGAPGASMALEILAKMQEAFPPAKMIAEHAATFLSEKQIAYEKLLQNLAAETHRYQQLIEQQTSLNQQLQNQYQAQQGLLAIERQKAFHLWQKELAAVQQQAQKLLNQLKLKAISPKAAQKALSALRSQEIHLQEQVQSSGHPAPPPDARPLDFADIKLQERYFIGSLGMTGVVVQKDAAKEEVVLSTKKTKWRCAARDLFDLKSMAKGGSAAQQKSSTREQVQVFIDATPPETQLNGRGMRLAEFQEAAIKAITAFENEQIPFLTIIHGHGTGALKNWLRQYLKAQKIAYTCENNDGVTCLKHENSSA